MSATTTAAGGGSPKPSWGRRVWRWGLRFSAVAYPCALLAVVAVFRLVGERWWATAAALYLPRVGFALPLPFLTVALLVDRSYRWLLTQLLALLLLLFPLMGLHLSGAHAATPGAPRLRLLSFNVDDGAFGVEAILAEVHAANPDVILFQEADYVPEAALRAGLPGYALRKTQQFVVASRFPIREVLDPPRLLHDGVSRSPRFMRYQLEAPGGIIQVYSVHPVSPREALDELRGAGLRSEMESGRILNPASAGMSGTSRLRAEQVAAVADDARRSAYPVIIAGDTNLPELSWAFARALGGYRDGFADAGFGFGYTFPAARRPPPWVRIDRILAGSPFRFLDFSVLSKRVSDHRAVVADLELAPAAR